MSEIIRDGILWFRLLQSHMSENDQRLLAIANSAAYRRGTEVLEAGFESNRDFSYRWRTDGKKIAVLYIPDYLDKAPDRVLLEFVEAAIDHIQGRETALGGEYMRYTTSDGFIQEKRPVFLKRSRNLARTDTGKVRNIYDAVQRLLDGGLLTPDDLDDTYFTWTSAPNYTRLGYCQQMFRVVAVSSVLDDVSIPEYVFDFVVYHECLHLRQGYRPFNRHPHDPEFHRQEKLYPMYREAEAYLKKIPLMRKGGHPRKG